MTDSGRDDHIAVVGIAGRFPGAPDVTAFWRNLVAGVDGIRDLDDGQLRAEGVGPSLLADPSLIRAGGQVAGVAEFDADFFGIDAAEAALLDPQQRLFLETAWSALEDAGYDPTRYSGAVGAFTSASWDRYFLFHLFGNPKVTAGVPGDWEGQLPAGRSADMLPARVAYHLGLTGPAIAVQTGCSSSLVAVCQAAQNLLDMRCDIALVGGVNVTWPRHRYQPGGLLSPDGRCRAYDARANGYGQASGVAAVVLKRLADVDADSDHVYAVLRGWAVNNDGRHRPGFAAPALDGQAAVVAEALAMADVRPDQIGYVEGNGSGTLIGDALEVAALELAWRSSGGRSGDPCRFGAVTTNVGNLDAAAGVAALIKTALTVQHGRIPPSLHFADPNPEIDFDAGMFTVPTETLDWMPDVDRIAGVSSFGLGGTNAHVIVAQPPSRRRASDIGGWHVLPISALTPAALRDAVHQLREVFADPPAGLSVSDVAYTLALGRREFAHRRAVICRDLAEAAAVLSEPETANTDSPDLAALADAWQRGGAVNWAGQLESSAGRRVPLPTYPFQRRRHWIDPPPGR